MKRILSILLIAFLLLAAYPHAAIGETEQSHIMEADQVLIYNPLPYDAKGNLLFTGTIATMQEDEPTIGAPIFTPGKHIAGKDCSTGKKDPDQHDFWVCTDLLTYRYDKHTFRLAAESAHCRVWTMEEDSLSFTDAQATAMAEQFESVIYPTDTACFGGFRDMGGDGKLEIVTYDMNSLSVCGFFDSYDLYTREEIEQIDPLDADSYNCLPIINVNSCMAEKESVVYGTLAHEFQHLILRSAALASPANADQLGSERTIGVWLNEGFSMAAEEQCYPGSVAEQGYLDAFGQSEKVRQGMSYCDFDATSNDVGAYGQSFLFAEYLRTQCGDDVFHDMLAYWSGAEDLAALSDAQAICSQLSGEQAAALDAYFGYSDPVREKLGSEEEIILSEFALAFRLAIVLRETDGLFAIDGFQAEMPVYTGTGRRIAGGGALLVECGGSFTVPADADGGLVFVGISDNAVTEIRTVPEPEEGLYVIAVQYNGEWMAIPAAPSEDQYLKPVAICPNADGTVYSVAARGAIFRAERTENGYRFISGDADGAYGLGRTGDTEQTLCVSETGNVFTWSHFADGSDRLQADGFYGRAILYGSYQGGFGYFASGYFDNATFAKPRVLRVLTVSRGDANLDGRVTAGDAALVLRTIVGLSEMSDTMRLAGDADGDGEVSAADAAKILRIVVHLDY